MNIMKSFQQAAQYLSEGFLRIFRPSDDRYPVTGVQPFEGQTTKNKSA